jgi:hypothetical protein
MSTGWARDAAAERGAGTSTGRGGCRSAGRGPGVPLGPRPDARSERGTFDEWSGRVSAGRGADVLVGRGADARSERGAGRPVEWSGRGSGVGAAAGRGDSLCEPETPGVRGLGICGVPGLGVWSAEGRGVTGSAVVGSAAVRSVGVTGSATVRSTAGGAEGLRGGAVGPRSGERPGAGRGTRRRAGASASDGAGPSTTIASVGGVSAGSTVPAPSRIVERSPRSCA